MQSQVNYRHGFKNGLFQYYYKNGNIKVQGKYKEDKRIGVWLINGKKRKYKDGKEL
jgi:antitoxin component YwqK of YwqJK toxin-antitoxin module